MPHPVTVAITKLSKDTYLEDLMELFCACLLGVSVIELVQTPQNTVLHRVTILSVQHEIASHGFNDTAGWSVGRKVQGESCPSQRLTAWYHNAQQYDAASSWA